jgi:hypothetical protein
VAVYVKHSFGDEEKSYSSKRKKVTVFDMRQHHIDKPRHFLGIHDWSYFFYV